MDPAEAMKQIERAFLEIGELRQAGLKTPDDFEALANAGRVLSEHADALSDWVSKGGFVPGHEYGAAFPDER